MSRTEYIINLMASGEYGVREAIAQTENMSNSHDFLPILTFGQIFISIAEDDADEATGARLVEGQGGSVELLVRNLGGAVGVAVMATLLARRGQYHHSVLVTHVDPWSLEASARLSASAS